MTELKLLSPELIAAATLATPVTARKHHLNARRVATDANAVRPEQMKCKRNRYRDRDLDQTFLAKSLATGLVDPGSYFRNRFLTLRRSRERNRSDCGGWNDHDRPVFSFAR
jgi:hypothetical protein